MKVLNFDDTLNVSNETRQRITTIRIPSEYLGYADTNLLLENINGSREYKRKYYW